MRKWWIWDLVRNSQVITTFVTTISVVQFLLTSKFYVFWVSCVSIVHRFLHVMYMSFAVVYRAASEQLLFHAMLCLLANRLKSTLCGSHLLSHTDSSLLVPNRLNCSTTNTSSTIQLKSACDTFCRSGLDRHILVPHRLHCLHNYELRIHCESQTCQHTQIHFSDFTEIITSSQCELLFWREKEWERWWSDVIQI